MTAGRRATNPDRGNRLRNQIAEDAARLRWASHGVVTTSTNQLIAELGVDSTSEAGSKLIQITADRSEPDEPAERDQPAAGIVPYAKGGFERSLQQQLAELLGGGREAKRPLRQ